MKVDICVKGELKCKEYPYIGYSENDDVYVLFNEESSGTVLSENGYGWDLGNYSYDWDEGNFVPLPDGSKITITV